MEWLTFTGRPLWIVFAVFAASAVVVWIAGTRIARYADQVSQVTGLGQAVVGLVLLAGITSLPEIAVSITSALAGTSKLAINNLLGSIAMQIALLAVADAVFGRQALTVIAGSTVTLLQVAMNILLLLLVAVAVGVGDRPAWIAGAWSWGLLFMYAFAIWKVANSQDRQLWVAQKTEAQKARAEQDRIERERRKQKLKQAVGAADAPSKPPEAAAQDAPALPALLWRLAAGAAAILVAGFLLSRTGDAIAARTGLGQSFVGAVLVAVSTSLPEVSSVLAAVKLRRYEMAISDIFGTNLFNVGMVFVVDAIDTGGPVLDRVGTFSLVAALLGALLAAIYLVGLLERRDRTIARMGVDSFAVLVAYLGGLVLLYQLR